MNNVLFVDARIFCNVPDGRNEDTRDLVVGRYLKHFVKDTNYKVVIFNNEKKNVSKSNISIIKLEEISESHSNHNDMDFRIHKYCIKEKVDNYLVVSDDRKIFLDKKKLIRVKDIHPADSLFVRRRIWQS